MHWLVNGKPFFMGEGEYDGDVAYKGVTENFYIALTLANEATFGGDIYRIQGVLRRNHFVTGRLVERPGFRDRGRSRHRVSVRLNL